MEIGIAGIRSVEIPSAVVRFFGVGLLFTASTLLAPSLSYSTADCTFSETDLRSVCTSDTDGDAVTRESFDEFPEPDDDAWVVIDVNDEEVDRFDVRVDIDDGHEVPQRWRVVGDLNDFYLSVENNPDIDVVIELAGDIDDPTDRRHSARINSGFVFNEAKESDPDYRGSVVGINAGSIISTGDGPTAYGLSVGNYSTHPDAEASAVNKGTIETRGTASRGMQARTDGPGTAEAINEGAVATRGGPDGNYAANAVMAGAGSGGTARAINASGATITTEGGRALALRATIEGSRGASDTPGSAIATNESGAIITSGGQGVTARVEEEAGTAIAINRGTILTTGDTVVDGNVKPYGLHARIQSPPDSGGEARALNSGTIETRGTGGRGIRANVEGTGTAIAINEGAVTTRGGPDHNGFDAHGVEARTASDAGTAQATNESGGTVTTTGEGAYGLRAQGGSALATNNGVILTTGNPTESGRTFGMLATSASTHVASEARVVNNGTVETHGVGARGILATIQGSGTAVAINEGTVATRGERSAQGSAAHGMIAVAVDSTALATNRGVVNVSGKSAIGMIAYTTGAGTAQVVVDGGTVRASYDSTTDDTEDGVGILGRSDSGSITTRIQRNAVIEAPVAARFVGSPADVIVDGSTISGAVQFDRFNDTLSVINSTFSGDIDFGGGLNTLVVQSSVFDSTVTGVSELFVRGSGVARFNRNVTFSGSSATIEDGTLMFAGDFNLGAEGTMTVYDSARVTALLTAGNIDDPPQIIAGGGIIAQDAVGNPADLEIYIQPDETLDEETRGDQATLQRVAQNVIAADTPVMAAGNEVGLKNEGQGGETDTVGTIPIMGDGSLGVAVVQSGAVLESTGPDGTTGESCPAPTAAASGGKGLLLAALLHADVNLFDLGDSQFGDAETTAGYSGVSFRGTSVPGTGWSLANWTSAGGKDQWTRAVSGRGPIWTSQTPTVGFDARFGGNFSIDVSASRDLSMSLQHEGAANQLNGGRYALRARWRGETLLAGASISRGEWRGQTAFANPVIGGGLAGAFDMNQTHAQAGVGARFDLGGLRLQPSATLFSGTVDRAAYRARGAAFRAAVPEIAQRYHGWKTEVRLSPADWLRGTSMLRWRPALDLNAMRTHGDAATFTLRQSARKGLLNFSSVVRTEALPRTVLAVGVSVDAMASEQWRIRVGYAGMLVDGKPEHGVGAGLQIRF